MIGHYPFAQHLVQIESHYGLKTTIGLLALLSINEILYRFAFSVIKTHISYSADIREGLIGGFTS